MKTLIQFMVLMLIIAFIIPGCEEETKPSTLTVKLTNHTGCKNARKSSTGMSDTPDTLSCVNYTYDSLNNKLIIKHINAGFNCCPNTLYCKVSLSNDTIIISEFESSALCDCNCLYDLDMVLTGIDPGKYHLKFIEPYCGEQQKIIFDIDLSKEKEDSFCVKRDQYPWGV